MTVTNNSELDFPLVGKQLGSYSVLDYLGTGGMATVYRGEHTNLRRPVAIKVLDSAFLDDEKFISLFHGEARNLASLRHPNVVQVYDFVIQEDIIYIVMEYVEGMPLSNLIEEFQNRKERVPVDMAVRIVKSICKGLSYAHRMNIIHRDIKPSNILIENTGRVVLADFGFAKMITGMTETHTGSIRGTPAYMAPEQTKGYPSRGYMDIYSLGVIFYEMITNQLPFADANPIALAMKHISEEAPRPRSLMSGVSKKIEKIIGKAMEKNPIDRYQTIDLMLKDIRNLKEAKTEKLPTATLSLAYAGFEDDLPVEEVKPVRISLHFMETGQILDLPEKEEFSVGRSDEAHSFIPDIDLTGFGGYEYGISRNHARLIVDRDKVAIHDLGSTNGTWVGGIRIKSDVPYRVEHGEIINLGKLQVQILLYDHIN